jgi:hypothetical protein
MLNIFPSHPASPNFVYGPLLLSFGPHLKKTQGTGIIAIVMKPRMVTAQEKFSLVIIWAVKSGKHEEMVKRIKVDEARTEAPSAVE